MERKLKGFTIIELLVVISIIAVLASISVPAAMVWIKDARLRDANEEARLVYSAVQDYLTELEIKNIDLAAGSSSDTIIMYSCSTDNNLPAPKIDYNLDGTVSDTETVIRSMVAEYGAFKSDAAVNAALKDKALDFSKALGDEFEGVWAVKINMDTYTVKEVCWTSYTDTITTENDPANGFSFDSVADQEAYMNSKGVTIGKFPV